jgi:hypothetical protein
VGAGREVPSGILRWPGCGPPAMAPARSFRRCRPVTRATPPYPIPQFSAGADSFVRAACEGVSRNKTLDPEPGTVKTWLPPWGKGIRGKGKGVRSRGERIRDGRNLIGSGWTDHGSAVSGRNGQDSSDRRATAKDLPLATIGTADPSIPRLAMTSRCGRRSNAATERPRLCLSRT